MIELNKATSSARAELVEIRRVSRKVRVACERLAPRLNYPASSLRGFCPFAATAITTELCDAGLKAHLVCGWFNGLHGHFWTIVEGLANAVVDVTARQFKPSWPNVTILLTEDKRRRAYRDVAATGDVAIAKIHHTDRDMFRILPDRWWRHVDEEAATLDARVLATLRSQPSLSMDDFQKAVGTDYMGLRGALGRLARRRPVSEKPAAEPPACELLPCG